MSSVNDYWVYNRPIVLMFIVFHAASARHLTCLQWRDLTVGVTKTRRSLTECLQLQLFQLHLYQYDIFAFYWFTYISGVTIFWGYDILGNWGYDIFRATIFRGYDILGATIFWGYDILGLRYLGELGPRYFGATIFWGHGHRSRPPLDTPLHVLVDEFIVAVILLGLTTTDHDSGLGYGMMLAKRQHVYVCKTEKTYVSTQCTLDMQSRFGLDLKVHDLHESRHGEDEWFQEGKYSIMSSKTTGHFIFRWDQSLRL